MTSDQTLAAVSDVSKTFVAGGRRIDALEHVTFEIARSELVAIVGPSGCGKSTLLNMLAGLERPSAGELRLEGEPIVGPRPDKVGFVFQDYSLLPWRNVQSNVELGLEFRGVPREERARQASRFIELVGLTRFVTAYPHQLSGGMRQRVAIARSLTLGCRLLLMDEPFGALDEQSRMLMGREVLAVQERTGCSIVLVTHSLSEAVRLADRVVLMSARPGRVLDMASIDLPRPRTLDVEKSEAFLDIRERLWKQLADQWTEN
jgi:NitT/TauT family transport system ATP-binding protein